MEKIKNPRKILVPAERERLIPKSGGKEKAYGFHGRAPDESPQRNHIKESGLLMPKQKCYPPVPLTDIRSILVALSRSSEGGDASISVGRAE